MRAIFLLTASFALAAAAPAFAQDINNNTPATAEQVAAPVVIGEATAVTKRVVEPVKPSFETLISAPIEYDENGVAKAQYFKASDLTPEQDRAFQEEIRRVRQYQAHNGGYTQSPNYLYSDNTAATHNASSSSSDSITYGRNAPVAANTAIYNQSTPAAAPFTSGVVEIDLYEPHTYGAADGSAYGTDQSYTTVTTVISEPVQQAAPTPAPQAYASASHTVAKGETLYRISKLYNVSVGQIQAENGLSGTNLSIGQAIRIPSSTPVALNSSLAQPIFVSAPVRDGAVTRRIVKPIATKSAKPVNSYAVLKKDTLYSIAKRACVSVNDLAAQNGIKDPSSLQLGQKLSLPAGHCQVN